MANGPSAGDFTGRQKQDLAKKAVEDLAGGNAEAFMEQKRQEELEQNGVFDAHTGQRIEDPGPSAIADIVDENGDPIGFTDYESNETFSPEDDNVVPAIFGLGERNQEPIFTGHEAPEETAPAVAARRDFAQRPSNPDVGLSTLVRVRVDTDIEKMTYGLTASGEPNNFDFKEGLMYEIPRPVAEHLNQRGHIRQWITR